MQGRKMDTNCGNRAFYNLEIVITSGYKRYNYLISFYTIGIKLWLGTGSCSSPEKCFDAAMQYLEDTLRRCEEAKQDND